MGKQVGSKGFGGRLKQARLQFGTNRLATMGQEELGRLLGVTGVTIGRWEDGTREPKKLAILERLAAILGVSAGWLAFGDGEMRRVRSEPSMVKRAGLVRPGDEQARREG